MQKYLSKLPNQLQKLILELAELAQRKHFSIYLVGGFVRDLLLGVRNLDLDIVVEQDGIAFAEEVKRKLNARLILHRRFKTATVIAANHLKIDIATCRQEYYPEPASLPVVTPSNLRDDLYRRDITINAMAISLKGEDFGRLLDFFGGKSDLDNKVIRVLHSKSFIDDPTRILRVIRFEQRYGFRIERNTLSFLKEAVREGMLHRVQPQRIRDELILLLKEENPLLPIKRLNNLVGFGFLKEGFVLTEYNLRLLNNIRRQIIWYNTLGPRNRALDSWLIYFLGIIESLQPAEAKILSQNLALRKGEKKRILTYKGISRNIIDELSSSGCRPSCVFRLLRDLSYEVIILLRARYKNKNLWKNIEDFLCGYNSVRLHIGGEDLKELGLKEGPHFQRILNEVLMAKLDLGLKTKEDELDFARKIISSK